MIDHTPADKVIISQLPRGVEVLVECECGCYEMIVEDPEKSIVKINAAIQFRDKIKRGRILGAIEFGKKLTMEFNNGTIVTKPILTATVSGDGWSYDVF